MKVLVAEDSRYHRKILEAFLEEWGYEVIFAENGAQAWDILERADSPQLVILDWVMPEMNGLEVCKKLREKTERPYHYVILLTNMTGQENIITGLEAGADDYVSKPFNAIELKWRLRIGRRIIELENNTMQMAMTDPLTGMLNRRAFFERLEGEIQRCRRHELPLSLIMWDIDNFKRVNDTYGHQIGDVVLTRLSAEISRLVRKYDFVGRYGGEEFIICLPGTDSLIAKNVAERLRNCVEKLPIIVDEKNTQLCVTASFGYTSTDKSKGVWDIDSLVNKTDEAVYLAKKQGRNRVCLVE